MNILNNEKNFKALSCSIVSMAIDKFIYKSPNLKNTLLLGAIAGSPNFIAATLQENSMIPDVTAGKYDNDNINIKTIEQRIIEISLSAGSANGVNTLILKNVRPNLSIQDCIVLFVAPSLIAEYITDYMFNQKLSYLA